MTPEVLVNNGSDEMLSNNERSHELQSQAADFSGQLILCNETNPNQLSFDTELSQ